mgnify:CR=1 FL=1
MKVTTIRSKVNYLLLFSSCVFLSGHSYSIVASSVVDVIMLTIGFVVCVSVCHRLRLPRHINASGLFILCIAIGVVGSYILYRRQNVWLDPILLIGKIGLAYLITQRLSFEEFSKLYSNVMVFLSAIAILVFLLIEADINIPNYSYIGQDNRTMYHTIWLCSWGDVSSPGIPQRIMGPFWEPGLYSSMTIFALLCEGCFTGRKPRKISISIMIVGILLSGSTAGYILTVLTLYIVVSRYIKKRIVWDIVTFFLFILLFLFSERIIDILVSWNPSVFWKLAEQSITGNTRLYSPIACFLVFLKNPFTGLGLSYATEQYNLYKGIFGMDALTSTSAFMLAALGIWGISYTIFLCRGVWKQKQFGGTIRLLLLVLLLTIVNKEPHTSILFTYLMMYYLNADKDSNEVMERNEGTLKVVVK